MKLKRRADLQHANKEKPTRHRVLPKYDLPVFNIFLTVGDAAAEDNVMSLNGIDE